MLYYFKLFIICLFFSQGVFPQASDYPFENITSKQGLSANYVVSIIQDNRGFIWIGTLDGLNRYDGYNFKTYKNIINDTTSLSDNKIRAICEDKNGDLWIGTWGGGLNKFDRDNETFIRFIHNPEDPKSISHNSVYSLCIGKDEELWIGTGKGLNRLEKGSNEFITYDTAGLAGNYINSIIRDKTDKIWIATRLGLYFYNYESNNFTRFIYDPSNPFSISSNSLQSVYEDIDGTIWVGTENAGLNKFNRETQTFKRYSNNQSNTTNRNVFAIFNANNEELWVGVEYEGLIRFNKNTEKFIPLIYHTKNSNSIANSSVMTIIEDFSGLLWFGTWEYGIFLLDRDKKRFNTVSYNEDNVSGLNNKVIWAIYEDRDGIVWIGTDKGGLNRWDKKENKFLHFVHNPNDPESISANRIRSICEDNSGFLWIGTDGGGINRLDRKTFNFKQYRNIPGKVNSISSDIIITMLIDKYGDLWIGTWDGGLNKFNRSTETFLRFIHNPEDSNSISYNFVTSLYEDKSGTIWIGTFEGGLNKFNRETGFFTHYKNDTKDPSSLSNNAVSTIFEDKEGSIWIGTYGGGLNKLNKSTGKFKHFSLSDGLPSEVIYGILEDDNSNLWLSTSKGLSRFNYRNNTFRNFDENDGLQGDEFNDWAYFKNNMGIMYFGGGNGFNMFHPDQIKDNLYLAPVIITDFELLHKTVSIGYDNQFDKIILSKSITETKDLDLSYNENIISFEFSALDFHSPVKNRYAYYLEGYDSEWNYTDAKKRFITYTNLDPGKYIFRVKASNKDGVWNEEGTSVNINISPPFWATWWAYAFYVIFFGSILYGIRRYEMNRLNWKNQVKLDEVKLKEKEETDRMKSRFFANISHEFRTPLTLILGPVEKIISNSREEETKKQSSLIKRNASRLLGLVNQLLDLSKLESGKLTLQASKGNIVSFVKGVAMSFESLAERKGIQLNFISKQDDIELYFDRDKMATILINLLSNAFKFTPKDGEITVMISESAFPTDGAVSESQGTIEMLSEELLSEKQVQHKKIIISIKDTGIGISEVELPKLFDRFYQVDSSHTKEYEGSGLGLTLARELVELHKGRITVKSKLGNPAKGRTGGSEFIIELPTGRNHLRDDGIAEIPEPIEKDITIDVDEYSIPSLLTIQTDPEVSDADKTIILIVEDNTDVREYIKDSLGSNYHFEEAVNGEQGVMIAEMIIPDLIISDIMMPKMDGNEFTKRIKNDERTSHIPVILLTAKSEQESRLEGLETGADDYLIKPFDTQELSVRIKNLITIRKKLQEKFSGENIISKKAARKLSSIDERFLKKSLDVVEHHLSEEDFSIEEFGTEVGMSRQQLNRKIKALTGKTASLYLRSIRLLKAKSMIEEKKGNISEIAYSVGFSSPAYFSSRFKEEFGYPPSKLQD